MSDTTSSSATRDDLIAVRNAPPTRHRRKRAANTTNLGPSEADEDDEALRLLDRLIRQDTLLYASNWRADKLIRDSYGADIAPDSFEYTTARTKVFDNVKNYQNTTINNIEYKHV